MYPATGSSGGEFGTNPRTPHTAEVTAMTYANRWAAALVAVCAALGAVIGAGIAGRRG